MDHARSAIPHPAAAASGAAMGAAGGMAGSGAPSLTKTISDILKETPSVDQKLFLVLGVALATVCFFTNIVQVGVFLRPSALKSVRSLLLLSQAVSGVFASFVVVFPIHVISSRGGSLVGESGFNACYLAHSGIILVTVLTSLSTSTLLLLHYYLTHNHPRRYTAIGNSLYGWGGIITLVWGYAFGIAILPWAGWNSWEVHDARCHLSTLWPLSFTAFLTFIVAIHMAGTLFLWASSRSAHLKVVARRTKRNANRGGGPGDAHDASPIAPPISNGNIEGRVSVSGWAIVVSSLVPLLGHVVIASSCAASSLCLSSPHHYHEDEASLPWATLLLTAAGIANPLLYIFSDDQLSSTTLMVLSRICCWKKRNGRPERLVPKKRESLDTETNVYVTNDTDQLVGDNT